MDFVTLKQGFLEDSRKTSPEKIFEKEQYHTSIYLQIFDM